MITPELVKALIEALKNNDGEAALKIAEEMLVTLAGGGGEPSAEELATQQNAETPPADPNEEEQAPPNEASATAMLLRITGTTSLAAAESRLKTVIQNYDTAAQQRATVDKASRLELIGKLVNLGAETPASAWTGDPEKRQPCKRLAAMDLEEMRAWVSQLEADPARAQRQEVSPPATETPADDVAAEVKKLSPTMLAKIKAKGMTPEEFIKQRNQATRRIHK